MQKYVLILGAKSDIARALAHQYAQKGYSLYLAARDVSEIEADAKDITIRYSQSAQIFAFDATKYDTHQAFYDELPVRPEVVIAVFGVLYDQEKAQNDWNLALNTIEVNFTGAVSILEIAAKEMENRKSGTIVGISSVAGDRGRASNYLYGSAKAGFTAYLSGLRNRLAKSNVHVVTVKPGFVKTAMTQNMKLPPVITAQPAQIAKDVIRAVEKKKNTIYSLWMWRYIMLIIKLIPEFIFKKMKL